MRCRRYLYDIGVFKQFCPQSKIISIGNITTGGTGKTPLTIFIAKYLRKNGSRVAVSHRGYKGKFENSIKLIADSTKIYPTAKLAGDEAKLLAYKLKGTPVIVGKSREKAIKFLERKFGNLDFIILDDSFQHLKVHHDIDIIVFNSLVGLGNGFVLPSGILREPIKSIEKADMVIINGKKRIKQIEKFNIPVYYSTLRIKKIYDMDSNGIKPTKIQKSRNLLVSGIGNPQSFENTLNEESINFGKHLKYPDHYNYDLQDWHKIQEESESYDYIITTEKDFMKLEEFDNKKKLVIIAVEYIVKDHNSLKEVIYE